MFPHIAPAGNDPPVAGRWGASGQYIKQGESAPVAHSADGRPGIIHKEHAPAGKLHRKGPPGDAAGTSVAVLPFQEDQREGVYQLYGEVFGPAAARSFSDRWRWAQEACLHPQDQPKWVVLDQQRVVGFLGTIALPYVVQGAPVLAHTPCDYMVHPAYRFHGVKLMGEFFRTCPNCVTCDDMPPTIKVTRWLGAQPVAPLVRWVKVLDARALSHRWSWAGAGPARWPINLLLRGSGLARRRPGRTSFRVAAARDFDHRFQEFFHRLAQVAPVLTARDRRFLEWRYGAGSPHQGRQIGVATDSGGDLQGYVIYYLSSGPQRYGCILDLQSLPPHGREVGGSLLNYAVARLRAGGAWSVRYHHLAGSGALPDRVLQQHGFMPRGEHQLLVRFQEPSMAGAAASAANWNYSYGDSEASHAFI
jgi:hypothetical protein